MPNSENPSSETEWSSFLNELVFWFYENELWVVWAIEAIKNLDISKQKVDTSSKIQQLKYLIDLLKTAEKEILSALFQDEKVTTKKIPLSKKNIKVLEPILKKIWVLVVYRNEWDTEFLNEIAPILMWESDWDWYFLNIEISKNKDWERYIKTMRIIKDRKEEKWQERKEIEDSDQQEEFLS